MCVYGFNVCVCLKMTHLEQSWLQTKQPIISEFCSVFTVGNLNGNLTTCRSFSQTYMNVELICGKRMVIYKQMLKWSLKFCSVFLECKHNAIYYSAYHKQTELTVTSYH